MIYGHGGNIEAAAAALGCDPTGIVDMSSNINPLGPLPGLVDELCDSMSAICRLPEADAGQAAAAYGDWQGILPGQVLAGAGTTQFLYQMPAALGLSSALVVSPTYADYADALAIAGVRFARFMLNRETGFVPDMEALAASAKTVDAVFFCNPNNPTGVYTPISSLEALARDCPDTWFVIDESYLPFVTGAGDDSMACRGLENVIVLQSLSKMFCIPGLRVGFCLAAEETADKISRYSPPWGVNALAQQAVLSITRGPEAAAAHIVQTRAFLEEERSALVHRLAHTPGLRIFPGRATFMLLELPGIAAADMVGHLLENRLLLRDCSNFEGLSEEFLRLSLKQSGDNQLAAERIIAYLDAPSAG